MPDIRYSARRVGPSPLRDAEFYASEPITAEQVEQEFGPGPYQYGATIDGRGPLVPGEMTAAEPITPEDIYQMFPDVRPQSEEELRQIIMQAQVPEQPAADEWALPQSGFQRSVVDRAFAEADPVPVPGASRGAMEGVRQAHNVPLYLDQNTDPAMDQDGNITMPSDWWNEPDDEDIPAAFKDLFPE